MERANECYASAMHAGSPEAGSPAGLWPGCMEAEPQSALCGWKGSTLLSGFACSMPHLSLGSAMWLPPSPSLSGTTLGQLFALCLDVASLGFGFSLHPHFLH